MEPDRRDRSPGQIVCHGFAVFPRCAADRDGSQDSGCARHTAILVVKVTGPNHPRESFVARLHPLVACDPVNDEGLASRRRRWLMVWKSMGLLRGKGAFSRRPILGRRVTDRCHDPCSAIGSSRHPGWLMVSSRRGGTRLPARCCGLATEAVIMVLVRFKKLKHDQR